MTTNEAVETNTAPEPESDWARRRREKREAAKAEAIASAPELEAEAEAAAEALVEATRGLVRALAAVNAASSPLAVSPRFDVRARGLEVNEHGPRLALARGLSLNDLSRLRNLLRAF